MGTVSIEAVSQVPGLEVSRVIHLSQLHAAFSSYPGQCWKKKKNIVLHIKTKLTYKKPKGFLKLFWNYPLLPNVDGMSC